MITWVAPCNSSLKQRAGNSLLHSLNAPCRRRLALSDTDMSDTLVRHNGLHIRKVQIDQARNVDQVRDSLDTACCSTSSAFFSASGMVVRLSTISRSLSLGMTIRVSTFSFKLVNSSQSVVHACLRLKTERLCHNAYSQNPHAPWQCGQLQVLRRFRFRRPYRR